MQTDLDYEIEVQVVRQGYDRKTCWVQTRGAVLPPEQAVITTQKLRLSGSDIFYAVNSLASTDFGRNWTEPAAVSGLGRRPYTHDPTCEMCPCDGTPAWHAASGKLLLTGHIAVYRDDELVRGYRRCTFYSVYDESTSTWSPMQVLELPETEFLYNFGAGCTQRWDLDDGTILLPVYGMPAASDGKQKNCSRAAVLKCAFDGRELRFIEHGNSLTVPDPRGFCEPSLTCFNGRYYLTLRNDVKGYVAISSDGLHYDEPKPWTFDNGELLGNYNTQQHWVTHSDGLFLVYTRSGLENDHVFRHRAPLVMAQVDPERLCIIRDTERIVVPEHGARLGNFGIATASAAESWVIVSEWMQTKAPNQTDSTVCERYGSDNRIYISRLQWNRPNLLFK